MRVISTYLTVGRKSIMYVSENVEILLKLVKNRTGETTSFIIYIENVIFPP